jgi:Zn-dependent oligopeptidase
LDEETRYKIKEMRKKLSNLQLEFGRNLNEENKKFLFRLDELGTFQPYLFLL